ncbi:hypothetical protein Tco_1169090 [Tanacetum coccineum]
MSMTIQSSVKDKILATSSETSKVENAPAEMLRDLDQQMEKRADDEAQQAARDRKKSYDYNMSKPLEFESNEERVMLNVGLVKIANRNEIVLGIECSSMTKTFHVQTKEEFGGLLVFMLPLEIKVDKTLHFVEEPVEIMDREVKSLKRNRILLVKVHWNSKLGPEFTWEREDHMKSKYP